MKKRQLRIAAGVFAGVLLIVGTVGLLTQTLGNLADPTYSGQTFTYWKEQLEKGDAGASNKASEIINTLVIPDLVNTMFHDTYDSKLRLGAIDALNGLPGIEIKYIDADGRRSSAAWALGELGPAAKTAIPELIKALESKDPVLQKPSISSLGRIRSEPEKVIPLLIPYLANDNLDVPAAGALAEFGSLSKAAVPKLVPLLKSREKDEVAAAKAALKKIDPSAARAAGLN